MAETTTGSSGLDPKIAGLLCWLFAPISSVIFLVIEKNDKSVKFHAWESMLTVIASWLIFMVVSAILTVTVIGVCLVPIIMFVPIVIQIVGAIKAYQGQEWMLPVVGDFSKKQAAK